MLDFLIIQDYFYKGLLKVYKTDKIFKQKVLAVSKHSSNDTVNLYTG